MCCTVPRDMGLTLHYLQKTDLLPGNRDSCRWHSGFELKADPGIEYPHYQRVRTLDLCTSYEPNHLDTLQYYASCGRSV